MQEIGKRLVVYVLFALAFIVIVSCKSKNNETLSQGSLFVKISPREGSYPQYSTFYVTVEVNKDADLCYTVREKDNPKPCEREFVFKALAEAGKPLTIPVTPEFTEGSTSGIFFLKIFAKSKDGEEVITSSRYEIILVPFINITPPGGFYSKEITVAIGCNKPCFLYYSTDGSEPKEKVEDGFILDIKDDTILQVYSEDKAIGIKSEIIKQEYYIDKNAPNTRVLGIEDCTCISGCDKDPKEVVRCKRETTVSLIAVDDKSPQTEIFWSIDGVEPKDDVSALVEAGGNTYKGKDSADIAVRSHTILKFFSKDLAGNKELVKTTIVLIGDRPFAYAVPTGGIFGKDSVPLKVRIYSIPQDATISYNVSFPDATTAFSNSCQSPCEITLDKEGKNIVLFRAFKGGLFDEQRRADFTIDLNAPDVSLEPASCFSDAGPISATIKSNEERVRVLWRICDKELPGCGMDTCSATSPEILSGTVPVTGIVIDVPSFVFYCGIDQAGNKTEVKKSDCEVSGRYVETFVNQDNMDEKETDASWGGGKLTIKRDSITEDGSADTQGTGTIDIDVYGKLAIIVDQGTGVKIIDISSPAAPGIVSQIQNTQVRSAELWNDILLLLTNSTLEAYDISNPRSPRRVGNASLTTDLAIPQNQANQIKVWGRYLVVSAGNAGVVLVRMTHNQTTATRSVSFEREGGISPSGGGAISNFLDVFGNIVAVAEGAGGLRLISIEKPSTPQGVTSFSSFLGSGEIATAVKIFFPYVAVGTNNGNIYLMSISYPTNVQQISSVLLSSGIPVNHIELWEKYLLVADNQGVKILDVGDPENPSVLYQNNRGPSFYILPYGDRFLVGDGNSGLFVYKIAAPSSRASELSVFDTSVRTVFVDGLVAGTVKSNRINIYDILDPFNPKVLTSVNSPISDPHSYLVWGNKLLVGDGNILRIFKFLPFGSISQIKAIDFGLIRSGVKIREIVAWGDHALVAGENSVFVVPLSDIANLSESSVVRYDVQAYDIDYSGDIVYVSTRNSKVVALRIGQGALSLLLDNLVSASVYEIVPFGRYLLTAQSISGLIAYDVSQIIFGRLAQIGTVPLSQVVGVKNFGYYTLLLRDDYTTLVDNTYIDRLREVWSSAVKSSQGGIFGPLAVVADKDGKAKVIRFAREKFMYLSESKAKSKNLTPDLKVSIKDAQLVVSFCESQSLNCDKVGCNVSFQLSNNGGATWVDVPPNSGFFPFGSTGTSLMWRANLRSGDPLVTPEICRIVVNYRFGR
ncbi:MAG: hypothetical protein N2254_01315 [bacterium]|nr:hypothetical protein [bacterium]